MDVEIVHRKQEDGRTRHFARIKGDDGRSVWVTQSYERSEDVWQAVELLDRLSMGDPVLGWAYPGRKRLQRLANKQHADGESGTRVSEVWVYGESGTGSDERGSDR